MDWWGWLVATLGGIILIANASKAARDLFAPLLALGNRVTELEKHEKKDLDRFEDIDKQFKTVDNRFAEQEATNQAILKGLVALINHELDGNSIENLKKTRDSLLDHIVER